MRRGNRGNGRGDGMDFPGGGFGGFPDPFQGFSMFGRGGGGRGRSLIEDFLGHDPFDDTFFRQRFGDPFFRRPFEDPFFHRPFGGLFGPPTGLFNSVENSSPEFLIDQRPFNPPQQGGRRGPVIEELPDDHEAPESESRPDHKEPIIEHPDDETAPETGDVGERRSVTKQFQPSESRPSYTSQSFCYQTSTVSGPGGAYYTSSTTRRAGPNGVMEEEHYEKDSLAGIESRRAGRALGDKMHAISKKRNADGREDTLETLHNLTEEEAVTFDDAWERQAEGSLLGSTSRSKLLEGNRVGSSRQSQLHLPSNEGLSNEKQQARKHLRR